MEKGSKIRKPGHPVDRIFPDRWSPRAMSGEPVSREELMSLFEAARWAPSSNNNQPWRFLYALKGSKNWDAFFGLLGEGNSAWAVNAGALLVVVSRNTFDYKERPSRTHSLDAGAAWMSLALQGSMKGLVVHGMEGFDYEKAKNTLKIPDGYTVECIAAVGKPGRAEDLDERNRMREMPSGRKSVSEFAFEGKWPEG